MYANNVCIITNYPGQDNPFHNSWCRALTICSQKTWTLGVNMLRGQEEQEEEGQVGSSVADELDERLSDEQAIAAFRRNQVEDG